MAADANAGIAPEEDFVRAVDSLVDECRETALWSLRRDWYPHTDDERRSVLRDIQNHGDTATFQRAARLLEWLSRRCSDASACS